MNEELDRKYRVINMMITMHSILNQHFKTKTLICNLFFLLSAVLLNIFSFFDYKYLNFILIDTEDIRNIISLITLIIFLLSIVFIIIDWGKKAERHEIAIKQLTRLLNELRIIKRIDDELILNQKVEIFNELYNLTFETIPQISNRNFNRLKAKHYQKLELSKYIDKHKGKPFVIIQILFYIDIFHKK